MSFVVIDESLADGGRISEVLYRTLSDPDSLDAFEKHLAHRLSRVLFQRMEAHQR
jgi:hypothetical protein